MDLFVDSKKLIEAHKRNTLSLAKHHRDNCDGQEDCNVSLLLLQEMAEQLGCEFTEKEKEVFV